MEQEVKLENVPPAVPGETVAEIGPVSPPKTMTADAEDGEKDASMTKKSKVLIYVGDAPNSAQPNLQNSFMKFREQKIKERQVMKMAQQAALANGRSAEYKANLRQRFIETAKRYLGVPYAQRFKAPEDPVAPLYLDCCGLVRQAVQDLQEEFGFVVGRWNQAYQIDTLPIKLGFEELQPGDLIFYEGTYYSNRSKPQKHNMVHVEIFLGGETGEATLASRYHRGKVSVFPSYKFESTTWGLVQHHFRSIDTWLDGLCKSCCPDHAWQSDSLAYLEVAGKRSIFSDATEEDVSAGGEEEDQQLPPVSSAASAAAAVAAVPETRPRDADDGEDAEIDESADAEREAQEGHFDVEESGRASASVPASSAIAAASAAASDAVQPKGAQKKPRRPSHFRDQQAGGSGATEVSKSRDFASESRSAKSGRERERDKDRDNMRTYYVGKSNGWRLVKAAMDKRAWQQLPFDYQFSTRYDLKWVERRSQIDYRAHNPGQLVCHIPNNDCITTKIGLLLTMRDKYCKQAPGSTTISHAPWLPATYDLDSPQEIGLLLKETERLDQEAAEHGDSSTVWIYKPSSYNRGRGIRVLSGVESLRLVCHGKQTNDPETTIAPLKGIVQKYIEKPLLVDGLKFDIRCYMLIARTEPTVLAFYHPGYCRLALKPYSLSAGGLEDTMMHLTNASVQKKGSEYQEHKDTQIQSVQALIEQLDQQGKASAAEYMRTRLDHDIKRCMVDVLKACTGKLLKKHGYFDLLGCDFMLTEDNSLLLLEINTNPALSLDNAVLEELLPAVVDGALELVLSTQGPEIELVENPILPEPLPSKFQPLLDEGKKWCYE